ncbi:carbohydrate ABC transporter permease [Paenibacillus albus]|uniref:Carbohydrate ABC transporter permease n=1 Tax=Paenibacillus albus TaxID=2495582 RepID=A0A3Q8X9B2_9BACL|nr:carbohydrate ABC transporter permease [Paenibacillus albus]AZN43119.1 carbohydrate ABC transporter permease [Paenibacillus albus]
MSSKRQVLNGVGVYTLLIALSIMCLIPFVWMVRSSLMQIGQIFSMPPVWIPKPFVFHNYTEAFSLARFDRFFLNTMIIVVLSTLGTVITSSLCAYSFSRVHWRGRDLIFGIILTSMMLPSVITLIPTFIGWQYFHAIDTYAPLIIPAWFGGGAYNIFLIRQFCQTIPVELDEAARVDGASHLTIFTRVIVPLVVPALVVVTLFSFLGNWNDFMGPLVYLNSESKFTLSLGLMFFKGTYTARWDLMMAASTVVVLPVLVVYMLGQRYFIEGIALTGVKG